MRAIMRPNAATPKRHEPEFRSEIFQQEMKSEVGREPAAGMHSSGPISPAGAQGASSVIALPMPARLPASQSRVISFVPLVSILLPQKENPNASSESSAFRVDAIISLQIREELNPALPLRRRC